MLAKRPDGVLGVRGRHVVDRTRCRPPHTASRCSSRWCPKGPPTSSPRMSSRSSARRRSHDEERGSPALNGSRALRLPPPAVPGIDLTEPAWRRRAGPAWSVEGNIGSKDPVESIMLHPRGTGDDALLAAFRIADEVDCRVLDVSDGTSSPCTAPPRAGTPFRTRHGRTLTNQPPAARIRLNESCRPVGTGTCRGRVAVRNAQSSSQGEVEARSSARCGGIVAAFSGREWHGR